MTNGETRPISINYITPSISRASLSHSIEKNKRKCFNFFVFTKILKIINFLGIKKTQTIKSINFLHHEKTKTFQKVLSYVNLLTSIIDDKDACNKQ